MTWLWPTCGYPVLNSAYLRFHCAELNATTAPKVFIGIGVGGTAITTLHLSSQLAAVRHPTKTGEEQDLRFSKIIIFFGQKCNWIQNNYTNNVLSFYHIIV